MNFHVCQQECGVQSGVGKARLHLPPRDADFMQNVVAVSGDNGIFGFAPQNVDGAAGKIVGVVLVREQWPGVRVGDDAACIVLIGISEP